MDPNQDQDPVDLNVVSVGLGFFNLLCGNTFHHESGQQGRSRNYHFVNYNYCEMGHLADLQYVLYWL